VSDIRLIHGEALQEMDRLIEEGIIIDAIICDLPYGTTACSWDLVIPFDEMWLRLNKLIKPNGAIVLFGSEPFSSALRMSNIKNYKYDWVWRKPRGTGHLNAKKMPLRDTENVSVFYSKPPTYNPQFSDGEPYSSLKGGRVSKVSASGDTTYGTFKNGAEHRNDNSGFRYPKTLIEFGVVERGTVHPTQKPVALMEYLIKTYTNENELVLDFTFGSGTTAVACKNINRSFVGIEMDETYYNIAKERVANV